MLTLIVFESMYGNTHAVATALAKSLSAGGPVVVVPVAEANVERVAAADLLVVGGPTHMHSMSSAASRKSAVDAAVKSDSALSLDGDVIVGGPGLRDWFDGIAPGEGRVAAAFDTRLAGPALLTGHASHTIASRLRKHGFTLLAGPESFLVDKESNLVEGEVERAVEWGARLLALVPGVHPTPT